MKCNNEDLFMKYMDNILTDSEEENLKNHMKNCHKCKKEFEVYEFILKGFSNSECLEAPPNFQFNVMAKVKNTPLNFNKNKIKEDLFCIVWGTVSVVMGIAILMSIYKELIIELLSSNEKLSLYITGFSGISAFAEHYLNVLVSFSDKFFYTITTSITNYRFYIVALFAIIFVVKLSTNVIRRGRNI